jgi:hypothetical protein
MVPYPNLFGNKGFVVVVVVVEKKWCEVELEMQES